MKTAWLLRWVLCSLVIWLTAGCSTPHRRAQQRAAAFGHLSPADQRLVLHGRIRQGMSRDAVYIAWGKPDQTLQGGKGRENFERWIYFSQLSNYTPIASLDQRYPGAVNLYAANFSPWSPPGFGYGGAGHANFLYPSRVVLTEIRYKRADFIDGAVRDFEVQRRSSNGLPLTR